MCIGSVAAFGLPFLPRDIVMHCSVCDGRGVGMMHRDLAGVFLPVRTGEFCFCSAEVSVRPVTWLWICHLPVAGSGGSGCASAPGSFGRAEGVFPREMEG